MGIKNLQEEYANEDAKEETFQHEGYSTPKESHRTAEDGRTRKETRIQTFLGNPMK